MRRGQVNYWTVRENKCLLRGHESYKGSFAFCLHLKCACVALFLFCTPSAKFGKPFLQGNMLKVFPHMMLGHLCPHPTSSNSNAAPAILKQKQKTNRKHLILHFQHQCSIQSHTIMCACLKCSICIASCSGVYTHTCTDTQKWLALWSEATIPASWPQGHCHLLRGARRWAGTISSTLNYNSQDSWLWGVCCPCLPLPPLSTILHSQICF